MDKIESHKHFILGENKQWFPTEDFIIHLAELRCFIRFDAQTSMNADYEEFINNVIHVEWIDGRPDEYLIERTLLDAYNFLIIEDAILDGDIDSLEYDDGEPF